MLPINFINRGLTKQLPTTANTSVVTNIFCFVHKVGRDTIDQLTLLIHEGRHRGRISMRAKGHGSVGIVDGVSLVCYSSNVDKNSRSDFAHCVGDARC